MIPYGATSFHGLSGEASGVDYVGGAKDGQEGLALCRKIQPDVVLVDLRLPDEDGFQFAARVKELPRAPRVLFLSCRTDDVTLFHAWSDSVAGLIWKSTHCAFSRGARFSMAGCHASAFARRSIGSLRFQY